MPARRPSPRVQTMKGSIVKATLIFDLVLIVMAAALINLDPFGYGTADGLFQTESMIARLHAPPIPSCILNCQR
jgi:hypothetical protein